MTIKTMEIDPKEIVLLEENARYMTHEEFNRLVDNVRRDGQLSSAPFCALSMRVRTQANTNACQEITEQKRLLKLVYLKFFVLLQTMSLQKNRRSPFNFRITQSPVTMTLPP